MSLPNYSAKRQSIDGCSLSISRVNELHWLREAKEGKTAIRVPGTQYAAAHKVSPAHLEMWCCAVLCIDASSAELFWSLRLATGTAHGVLHGL